MKKIIAYALSFAIMLSLISLLAPFAVSAAEPSYTVSAEYKKSRYYENLQKVPLSGDQAIDTVAIALSQLGYHEGNSNADLGGLNTSGTRDFVEYNVLYGKLDNNQGNGVSYGYYWCASFVNWCLRQARVSKSASAAAEVSCQRWLAACKSADIYVEKSGYLPRSGDLIFFKDSGSYVSSTHMGIVLYCDGSRVYTVEGNTSNGSFSSNGNYVALKDYVLTSSYIVGYAIPQYERKANLLQTDYSGSRLSPGVYIAKEDSACFDNPELRGESRKIGAYTVFTVTEIYKGAFRVSCESNGKRLEGWASLKDKAKQMTTDSYAYTVAYLDEGGEELLPTQYRSATEEIKVSSSVPTKKNAGFLGWSLEKGVLSDLIAPGDTIGAKAGDMTLYANWDYTFYLVTFKDSNGSVISQKYGYYGDTFEVPTPENIPDGYVFAGWDGGEVSGVITGDASYTAVYRERSEIDTETKSPSGNETEDKSVPVGGTGLQNGCRGTVGCEWIMLILLAGAFAVPAFKKKDN
jgi:hypothetical protein